MRRFSRCPVVLPLVLLFGALVLPAPAPAAPPAGSHGMPAMSGGMMAPAPPSMMRNTPSLMAPGMGMNQAGFRPLAPAVAGTPAGFGGMPGMPAGMTAIAPASMMQSAPSPMAPGMGLNQAGFRPQASPQPGYAPASSAMPGQYGYGSSAVSPGGGYAGGGTGSNSAAGTPTPYDSSYGTSAAAAGSSQNAPRGPLVGLLKAEGGLDWPLALRILPPGLETRDLRQSIDARAAEIQRQAAAGRENAGLLRETNRDVDRLGAILADRGDFLPVSQQATTEGRQFLRRLRDALRAVPESAARP